MNIACISFPTGCPRSKMDAALLEEYLKQNGWMLTTILKDADLILLASCGFNTVQEEKSIKFLSITLSKIRGDARVIVFGCLPGINMQRISDNFNGNVEAIHYNNLNQLDDIINATHKLADVRQPNIIGDNPGRYNNIYSLCDKLRVRLHLSRKFLLRAMVRIYHGKGPPPLSTRYSQIFNIRIARGCLSNCTYCAIKFSSGSIRSNFSDDFLSEFHSGLSAGNKTFCLVAEDVGAYGQDIGTNIVNLLEKIFKHQEDFQLIWDDFNIKWLIQYFPQLIEVIKRNNKRIGYLGFPIQSGSKRMLKLMKRDYCVEDAYNCLRSLQKSLPQLDLTTHVLVGFPGETEEDFNKTIDILRTIRFKHIDVYKYDDRPNTESAILPGQIAEKTKYRRVRKILKEFPKISTPA